MANRIFRIILIVWVVLWACFIVRELFVKKHIREYGTLLSRDAEGKRSFVTGDRLYGLLQASEKIIPAGSAYRLIGSEDGSLDKRRAAYYLYPRMEKEPAEYIIVYDLPVRLEPGYRIARQLDEKRYILKREE